MAGLITELPRKRVCLPTPYPIFIAMAQFFAEDELVELTPELKELVDRWTALSDDQKAAIWQIIKTYE